MTTTISLLRQRVSRAWTNVDKCRGELRQVEERLRHAIEAWQEVRDLLNHELRNQGQQEAGDGHSGQ